MPDTSLRRPLVRLHRAQERRRLARHVLRATAACAVAITLALAAGVALRPGVTGSWVRLALLALAFLALAARALGGIARERLSLAAWLEHAEARFPELRSWLRNALELESAPPPDTSAELAGALVGEAATRLATVPLQTLAPRIDPRRPALLLVGALAVVIALGVLLPQRTLRSWSTLWSPESAAPELRLAVEPGSVTVTPGAALAVHARVWGSHAAPGLTLDDGARAQAVAEGEGEGGARLWRFDLTQLTRETGYRVKVARVASPRYAIRFSGAASPVGFRIEYRAPAYARLPLQSGAAARGDLTALRGSIAGVEVTFDRDLDRLEGTLPDGRSTRWTALTPRRWRGEVPVDRPGDYTLVAAARPLVGSGASVESRHAYRVTPLDDAPPVLSVRLPEGDLDLPAGQQIALDLLGQDDLGLGALRLEFRKDAAATWTQRPLARFDERPREATVSTRWDASALGLVPGQTASFRFVLTDDNVVSGPGTAVSPTYTLRFPSLAELYEKVDRHQEDARTTLEKAAEQARDLQKSLDKLARQVPDPDPRHTPSFERSEEMRSATQRQQEVTRQIEQATDQLHQSLEQAAERRAFDEQLQSKLQELNQLMQQVQSQELRDAMKEMQQALERMDRQQMDRNLDRMRQANQETMQNIERTLALLKQLREEEKLQALAQRAQELKQQQDALNQEHQSPPKPGATAAQPPTPERQQKAAEQSEQLARDAREAMKDPEASDGQEALDKASQALEQEAAPEQHQAAEASRMQRGAEAQSQGQKASEALQKAAEQLGQAAQSMQQGQQSADLAAMRRAAQDLVALQRAAESNLSSGAPLGQRGDQQTDLAEGTARIADSLQALGKRSPALTPQLTEALGRAMNGLQRSGMELGAGNRARGEQSGRDGATALNQAVLELRQNEQSMCNKPGNNPNGRGEKGTGGRNPQRLGALGERQSQLNQQSQGMARRLTEQMRMSSGDQAEMRRLAEEQARIREELESVQRDEEQHKELLGRLDATQKDMQAAEEQLRQGNASGDLEEVQQRILSRLLDAQRSVNRRDFQPERESRAGVDVARESPAALPPEMLREDDRLRLDLLKAEADRYPAQYRAFIESYLRTLNGSRR